MASGNYIRIAILAICSLSFILCSSTAFAQGQYEYLLNAGCGNESGTSQSSSSMSVQTCQPPIDWFYSNQGVTNGWTLNVPFLPEPNDVTKTVKVNFVFLQKDNGTGNFEEDNPEHMAFIDEVIERVEDGWNTLGNPNFTDYPACDYNLGIDYINDTKIQLDIQKVFIEDEILWNHDLHTAGNDYWKIWKPNHYLHPLSAQLNEDPVHCRAINVFFMEYESHHDAVLINGQDFGASGLPSHAANSTISDEFDFDAPVANSIPNQFTKYWWMKNVLAGPGNPDGYVWDGQVDYWHYNTLARTIRHELGHAMGLWHQNECFTAIMNPTGAADAPNSTCPPTQVGKIHRAFAHTSSRRVVTDDTYDENSYVITTAETWDKDSRIYKSVIVEDGGELTITCKLLMPYQGRIEVRKGGTLLIDGGIITSENKSNTPWHGIFVEGDENGQTNGNPGRVEVFNEGTIEHAGVALNNFLVDFEDGCSINWGTQGGVIQCHDVAILRDNKRDAQFLAYWNINNGVTSDDQSYFANTDFQTTTEYDFTSINHNVTMWKVRGVDIKSCRFFDERTSLPVPQRRAGLFTIDASYKISKNCPSLNPDCAGQDYTSFTDLSVAVESHGKGIITIARTNFDCQRGIILRNNAYATIVRNNFEVDTYLESQGDQDRPFGILMDRCRSYQVEENELTSDAYSFGGVPIGAGVGIVVNNDDDNNEQIYGNDLEGFGAASEAIGWNRVANNFETTGLQFRCNDYQANFTDIYVRPRIGLDPLQQGVAKYQGNPTGLESDLAGNFFSVIGDNPNIGVNYVNPTMMPDPDMNVNHISYFMHDPISEPRVEPTYSSNVSGISLFTSDMNVTSSTCPSGVGIYLSPSGGMVKKFENEDGIAETELLLTQLVDDGDTESLQAQVAMTSDADAWAKYLNLMDKAGYLSDDVLEEIASKEEGFTVAMIRDILYANPQAAKSAEVDEALEEREDPLPDYMIQQIKSGLTKLSAKEYIELIRDNYRFERDMVVKHTVRGLLQDSETDHSTSIMLLLSNTGDIDFDYDLLEYYDTQGESFLADGLVTVMQSYSLDDENEDELSAFISIRSLLADWEAQDKDLSQLSPADIDELQIFADREDRSSAAAQSLLRLNGVKETISVYLPSADEKRLSFVNGFAAPDFESTMEVFPNPAEDYFTLSYQIISESTSPIIMIMVDLNGRTVKSQTLVHSQDRVLISTEGVPSGNYLLTINQDGKLIGSTSMTVLESK